MKKIIIGFSKPKSFKLHAWLIMKIDKADYDHAYIKFHSDTYKRDIIYQAIGKGVEFKGLALFEETTQPVEEYELDIEDNDYIELMKFCIDNAGISYGFLSTLGVGISKLFKIKNPFSDGLKTEFCDEIVFRCLNKVDPKDFCEDPENISPKDVNNIIQELNIKRIL